MDFTQNSTVKVKIQCENRTDGVNTGSERGHGVKGSQ